MGTYWMVGVGVHLELTLRYLEGVGNPPITAYVLELPRSPGIPLWF